MSSVPLERLTDAAEQARASGRVVQVWDLPLRIFHWTLVIAIVAAYLTAEFGGSEWMQWHGRIGAFVLALLVFRVVWGVIGTHHARFRTFVPTPARIGAYLRGAWQSAGHNPLGALSVIALLILLGAQVLTGLFSNDDIAFAGPWSSWIDKSSSDWLTGWHQQLFCLLAGLIGLHVLAILFYLLIRKSNLVTPMVTGKRWHAGDEPTTTVNLRGRFVLAVSVATAAAWLAFRDAPAPPIETVAPPASPADW
jgi:cytochrome b